MKRRKVVESFQKTVEKRNTIFRNLETLIDNDTSVANQDKKIRKIKPKEESSTRMSKVVVDYHHAKQANEQLLEKTLQKVNIDKTIVLREKVRLIWRDSIK